MKLNQFGNTGLLISELTFGTMTFGGSSIWQMLGATQQEEANRLVARAIDGGINCFDTADIYSAGESERILGAALEGKRHEVLIATKVKGRIGNNSNSAGLNRVHIMNQVENSLRNLRTDYIDLYQIHGFDPFTPPEDTLRTLNDLVRSGKVRYIGVSNLAAWQIAYWAQHARLSGLEPIQSVQAYYSLAGRSLEREVIPACKELGLGIMVWSPLAGGFLTGKFRRDNDQVDGARRTDFDFPPVDKERSYDIIEVMAEIAEVHSVSIAQIALAWVRMQPGVTTTIIGARRMDQLEDNLKSVEIELSADELQRLDAVSALGPEYPGWMVNMPIDRYPGSSLEDRVQALRDSAK